MSVTFSEWTQNRSIVSFGTNAGAKELPFQTWRNFKEAYAPELIARAIDESTIPVRKCLDPFGGSGTTALACQFLGVHPTTIEVNPFLADLIEAKLVKYDADMLAQDLGKIAGYVTQANDEKDDVLERLSYLPATFIEPGVNGRWIFDRDVASRVSALHVAINKTTEQKHRRLFLVLLGGILISVSNVMISGKGRRYRHNWWKRKRFPTCVDEAFFKSAQTAISDIHRYANRLGTSYELIRGDCRTELNGGTWDLAIFSPPYPNSFDYTDVYNVELWTLGYLKNSHANRKLRQATLTSHVQTSRPYDPPPEGSPRLETTLEKLAEARSLLWNHRIPEMVGAYFADLMSTIERVHRRISTGGSIWLVVGDSRYAGVQIETADIIIDLAEASGWRVNGSEPFRSMRSSAQQGGRAELTETLIKIG